MRRRGFIGRVCATIGAALGLGASRATAAPQAAPDIAEITQAIHAHYGPGFAVLHSDTVQGRTTCVIAHCDNRFQVVSDDLKHWDLLKYPSL